MYTRKEPTALTGGELFKNNKKKISILNLWKHAFSNVLRGTLAEFLVESALKKPSDINIRNPRGDYNVVSENGSKIEVKCSAFLQDWDQNKLSTPIFSGLKAKEIYWNKAVSGEKYKTKKKKNINLIYMCLHF